MTLTCLVDHFDNVKKVGENQYSANCPSCGDTNRHLYLSEKDGKILLDCKHGCSFGEIVQASGLKSADFFPPKESKPRWTHLREHIYTDKNGSPVGKKTIYDKGNGDKTAVWERFENGRYVKGLNGAKMPPYHLHKLLNAEDVIIVEGEKDVETVEQMGLTATTSPNGAGGKTSWVKAHNGYFRGKRVVILTDNDDAGRQHGRSTADSLSGTAKTVLLIPSESLYPELKPKGDISDIVAAVGSDKALELLAEAVRTAVPYKRQEAAPAMPKAEVGDELLERLVKLDPVANYEHNDIGSSKLFADLFRHQIRFNTTAREWYVYDGKVWKIDSESMRVKGLAKQFYDVLMVYGSTIADSSKQKAFYDYYLRFNGMNKRHALIKDAADYCFISSEDFDKNIDLLNCQNGTFNLRTYKLQPHDPADLITKISNVWYDPSARADVWEKFIIEVLENDKEKIRYLQKAVGYSLSGTCSLETCFILFGATTRNGKSTAISTISYMLGSDNGYARSAPPEVLALKKNKDSRAPSEDIARLAGCRFLSVNEPPQSMAFDAALLKSLTGRDTITARFLNQGSFEYVPQFVIFINTNHLPKVLDDTLFSSNRLNVIEFKRHFEEAEQDRSLKSRLQSRENISGLFNWCVEGLKAFRTEGLEKPLSVNIATRQYAQQSDKLGNFIEECLEESEGCACTAKEIYDSYKSWCMDSNYYAESKQKFMELLRGKSMLQNRGIVNGKWTSNVVEGYIISG